MNPWVNVHYPIEVGDVLPQERKTVLCWLRGSALPFCGYIRIHSGGPFFVVYHGNPEPGAGVIAWCDCLPSEAPEPFQGGIYETGMRVPSPEAKG